MYCARNCFNFENFVLRILRETIQQAWNSLYTRRLGVNAIMAVICAYIFVIITESRSYICIIVEKGRITPAAILSSSLLSSSPSLSLFSPTVPSRRRLSASLSRPVDSTTNALLLDAAAKPRVVSRQKATCTPLSSSSPLCASRN